MSGTQPPPRFHIDQPQTLSGDVAHADLGRVFDRQTRKIGRAGWDGWCALIVFMPDQIQPHLTATLNPFDSSITVTGVGLASGVGRFIPLDHPDLYPLIGTAIQRTAYGKLEAIGRARVVFDLGLAEAKALIESTLNEGAERGPITGVTLKDGRTVVMRQQDDDEAKERERKSMEELRALDDLRAQDMDGAFKFRDYLDAPPHSAMPPEVRAKLDEAVAKFQALPAVQAQIRMMSKPSPISVSGTTVKPVDGYAVDIRTNTTRLWEFNHHEQIKAANERAQAATAEAARLSSRLKDALDDGAAIAATAREANATFGRVMHVLRGVVTFPDVQHVVDPELPPEVREALADLYDLIARQRVQPPHPDWTLRQGLWARLYPDGTTALVFSDHQWTRGLGGPDPVRGIAKSQREAMVDADAAA